MTHYSTSILADIARATNADQTADCTIGMRQNNAAHGICQALVSIPGTPGNGGTRYRLLLAPLDAPINIGCLPADEHFEHVLRETA